MIQVRLQKHIADLGICSRRKAEELIASGKVFLNGKKVTEMGVKIDPKKDSVSVKGHAHTDTKEDMIYIALNKPIDYITSASSKQGTSIMDLLTKRNHASKYKKEISARVYPVGRLDKESEGLVLLTNDGELTNTLTHPRYEHEKEYDVTIAGRFQKETRKILEQGMNIGKNEYVKGIKIKKIFNKGKRTIITVILTEGKNRQIRRMFGRLGYDIVTLKRTRIGKLKLGTLSIGKWKFVARDKII